MATATFFLKNKNSKNPTLIFLIFQFNHYEIVNGRKKFKFLKYSTNEKIHPDHWDFKTHRAKQKAAFPGHLELNRAC